MWFFWVLLLIFVIWLFLPSKKITIKLIDSDDGYSYSDDNLTIKFLLLNTPINIGIFTNFAFYLDNKTNQQLYIDWDSCAYVDENGFSNKIIHGGVQLSKKNESQRSTMVAAQSMLADNISPVNCAELLDITRVWVFHPIFRNCKNSLPVNVRVLLSVRKNTNEIMLYDFKFSVQESG